MPIATFLLTNVRARRYRSSLASLASLRSVRPCAFRNASHKSTLVEPKINDSKNNGKTGTTLFHTHIVSAPVLLFRKSGQRKKGRVPRPTLFSCDWAPPSPPYPPRRPRVARNAPPLNPAFTPSLGWASYLFGGEVRESIGVWERDSPTVKDSGFAYSVALIPRHCLPSLSHALVAATSSLRRFFLSFGLYSLVHFATSLLRPHLCIGGHRHSGGCPPNPFPPAPLFPSSLSTSGVQ